MALTGFLMAWLEWRISHECSCIIEFITCKRVAKRFRVMINKPLRSRNANSIYHTIMTLKSHLISDVALKHQNLAIRTREDFMDISA